MGDTRAGLHILDWHAWAVQHFRRRVGHRRIERDLHVIGHAAGRWCDRSAERRVPGRVLPAFEQQAGAWVSDAVALDVAAPVPDLVSCSIVIMPDDVGAARSHPYRRPDRVAVEVRDPVGGGRIRADWVELALPDLRQAVTRPGLVRPDEVSTFR